MSKEQNLADLIGPKTTFPEKIKSLPRYKGAFDAFELAANGARVLFATYPAGTHIKPHDHDSDNYGVITRGELKLTINGQVIRYGVGCWYHIPAFIAHQADFDEETDEIEFWFG